MAGAAPNAVWGLIELLSKCKDEKGHIQIPGMYDDVEPPAPQEKQSWTSLPFNEDDFLKKEVGATALTMEPGFSVLESTWARPTMEVHGIAGGFTGAGAKTVIPAKATAKVSFRMVPNQDPDKIVDVVPAVSEGQCSRGRRDRTAGAEREPGHRGEPGSSGD